MNFQSGITASLTLADTVAAAAVLGGTNNIGAFAEILSAISAPLPRQLLEGQPEDAESRKPTGSGVSEQPQPFERPRKRAPRTIGGQQAPSPPPRRASEAPDGDATLEDIPFLRRAKAFRGKSTDWLPSGRGRRPIHFPLIHPRQFRAILSALGQHTSSTGELDVPRMIEAVATMRSVVRLPYKRRKDLGDGLVVLRDSAPAMIPFQPDMVDFIDRAKRHLGRDKVLDVPLDADHLAKALQLIRARSTVIVLSDLHGFAWRFGYPHLPRQAWLEIQARLQVTNSRALVLSPGAGPRTGDSEAAGYVATPAFAALFRGPRPIARVLPWDGSLTPRRAAAFGNGRHEAVWLDDFMKSGGGHQNSADRLLRLVALVHDVDQHTLRTLRLVLSDPRSILVGYREEIQPADRDKHWNADMSLAALDPEVGALHEHAVWVSSYIAYRGDVGLLSSKMQNVRQRLSSDMPPQWPKVVAFAREALARCRAGRGLIELLGDHFQWAYAVTNHDPKKGDQELSELLKAAELVGNLDQSTDRLGRIDRSLLATPTKRRPTDSRGIGQLGLRRVNEVLHIGLDMADVDLEFPLEPDFHPRDGVLELWPTRNADAPAAIHRLWPLPLQIPLRQGSAAPLRTIVLRLGSTVTIANLGSTLSDMQPVFRRNIDDPPSDTRRREERSLRFEGQELHFRGRRYDPIGLRYLGEVSEPEMGEVEGPEGASRVSVGAEPLWAKAQTLFARRSSSSHLGAMDVPGGSAIDRASGTATRNGHLFLATSDQAWHFRTDGNEAAVVRWELSWLPSERDFFIRHLCAASRAGGVVATEFSDDGNTRLFFFGHSAADEPAGVVSATLNIKPTEIALRDDGFVAAYQNRQLYLYEPVDSLGTTSTSVGSALLKADRGTAEPALTIHRTRRYKRIWLATEDHELASLCDALVSTDSDSLARVRDAIKRGLRPSADEIRRVAPMLSRYAEAIAAVLAQNDGYRYEESFALPGSRLTLLHIACSMRVPGRLVPSLLGMGCDPNSKDLYGRTPLYVAAFCEDDGETLSRLLDAGGDPSISGAIGTIRIGPLAPALHEGAIERSVSLRMIDRLIDGGADPLAFANGDQQTALQHAASHRDPAVLERILEFDRRVEWESADGWTALTVAAYYGLTRNVELLISHKAPLNYASRVGGRTALVVAIEQGHSEVVELLLKNKARANGTEGARVTPLQAVIGGPSDVPQERVEAIAAALARGGVDADVEPWPCQRLFAGGESSRRVSAVLEGFARVGHSVGLVETTRAYIEDRKKLVRHDMDVLLRQPLDFNAIGKAGLRLVHLMAMYGEPAEKGRSSLANPFEALLEKGAELQAVDESGSTALHYAAAAGNVSTARLLLQLVPDLASRLRHDGHSAADLAYLFGHQVLAEELGSPPPSQLEAIRSLPGPTVARLTFLPQGTEWRDVSDVFPARRATGRVAPLPASLMIWVNVMTREALLPYRTGHRLRETWWQRDDGVVGISADVIASDPKFTFTVNGNSERIHALNKHEPPDLTTSANAIAYLKFFCHSIHGTRGRVDGGPFAIADTEDSLLRYLGLSTPPPEGLPNCQPRVWNNESNEWLAEALVCYGSIVSEAKFSIAPSGIVAMTDDSRVGEYRSKEEFRDADGIFYFEKSVAGN